MNSPFIVAERDTTYRTQPSQVGFPAPSDALIPGLEFLRVLRARNDSRY